MRLLHTMLRVGDLQRSIDFYTKVLGMKLLRTSENPEYKYSLAFVGGFPCSDFLPSVGCQRGASAEEGR